MSLCSTTTACRLDLIVNPFGAIYFSPVAFSAKTTTYYTITPESQVTLKPGIEDGTEHVICNTRLSGQPWRYSMVEEA
jgi:hypothetical protein